jgi:glycine oxidase
VTLPRTPDVLVIGGGVIGCAIAREVAATGRRVLVVDRGAIGGEASSAAAGVLGVASGADEGDRLALRRASAALFPALVAALESETGIDVGFACRGILELAFSDDAERVLRERIARRRANGFDVEPLDAAGVRALEPAANRDVRGGALFPADASVVAERLVAAYAEAARRRGATLVPGTPVVATERSGDRVVRVRAGGDWLSPETVVVAAGAWSSCVPGLDPGPSIRPVRGQMMALRPPRPIRHVLTSGDAFLVPRPEGEVWVGATFEDVGFVKGITPAGLRTLAGHVERLVPELAASPVVRAWSGLRPMLDAGPAIGRISALRNGLIAAGHHRSGILLAPITAAGVAAHLEDRDPPAEVRAFGPR